MDFYRECENEEKAQIYIISFVPSLVLIDYRTSSLLRRTSAFKRRI